MTQKSTRLEATHFLLLDIQASGANPTKANLLEIGWAHVHGLEVGLPEITSYLALQPQGTKLSPRITRITGITRKDLERGETPHEIWNRLSCEMQQIAKLNKKETCPLVIHFARYEMPFLESMANEFCGSEIPRWKVICTHALSTRLLPELPRKGLRAVCGYLGHSIPEARRAALHVEATHFVWQHFLSQVCQKNRASTLQEIEEISNARTIRRQKRKYSYPMPTEARKSAPRKPGIYRMRSCSGDLLYVGKAKSLHRRVLSYFRPGASHPEHILEMLSQAQQLEFEITPTAVEAALYEEENIKRFSPPYNIALKPIEKRFVYCDSRFARSDGSDPSDSLRGPLPESIYKPFHEFWRCLKEGEIPSRGKLFSGMPGSEEPSSDLLQEGMRLFLQNHFHDRGPSPVRMKQLGLLLWIRRKNEQSNLKEDPREGNAGNNHDEREWTDVKVLALFEKIVLRFFRHYRRSQWLNLLANSCLEWQIDRKENSCRILRIEGGRIQQVAFPGNPYFSPGGCCDGGCISPDCVLLPRLAKQSGEKCGLNDLSAARVDFARTETDRSSKQAEALRQSLDPVHNDRLIVLTIEIRRLLREGRRLELKLASGRALGKSKLRRILRQI